MPEDLKTRAQREMADQQEVMRETGPYLTLGIQLVLTILVFFGAGYWLDHHFETGSLWVAILTSFGAIMSLVYFIIIAIGLQKKDDARSAASKTKRM
jgi:F0F1-type ATP synthase assembly protein I